MIGLVRAWSSCERFLFTSLTQAQFGKQHSQELDPIPHSVIHAIVPLMTR
ncbi:MAG: hypothetical protein RLP02_18550 [Coleofasciculus sp. C2-GNP5-27]